MYYTEYGQAAIRHYHSVKQMFDACVEHTGTDLSNGHRDILYRIYYLCGHIIECVAVYWIYRHYRWDINNHYPKWKGDNADIKICANPSFTERSHFDFYPAKIVNGHLSCQRTCQRKNVLFTLPNKTSLKESDLMHISGHEFQKYIEQIIVPGNFVQAPFFRQMEVGDENYEKGINLLNWWQPDIRYYYEGRESHFNYKEFNKSKGIGMKVDIDSVFQLLEICRIATRTIVHTPKVRQLLPPSA